MGWVCALPLLFCCRDSALSPKLEGEAHSVLLGMPLRELFQLTFWSSLSTQTKWDPSYTANASGMPETQQECQNSTSGTPTSECWAVPGRPCAVAADGSYLHGGACIIQVQFGAIRVSTWSHPHINHEHSCSSPLKVDLLKLGDRICKDVNKNAFHLTCRPLLSSLTISSINVFRILFLGSQQKPGRRFLTNHHYAVGSHMHIRSHTSLPIYSLP